MSIGLFGLYFAQVRRTSAAEVEGRAGAAAAAGKEAGEGAALEAPLRKAAERFLSTPVALSFDGKSFQTRWKDLGLVIDEGAVTREASRLAASGLDAGAIREDRFARGGAVPLTLSRERALDALVEYKDSYDRPSQDARIDLENRKVLPESNGYGIKVYESLALVEDTARAGKNAITLIGGEIHPQVTKEKLGNLEVSTVLGWFETKYPPGEKDRNYNLKLAAEKLNGHILMPGQELSFNAVVGDRTEKEGFRVAHVITAGEMVDGLAGGTCQISSTLHGAAWFAGLDIVHSLPHSRPSAYITMALDATVVYPTTDLKLKNSYDFPVVIRYVVAQGTVRVEILGKERPYTKVEFEREIKEELPYQTITREDDTMPVGSTLVEQLGFPGYQLIRRRRFWQDGKPVKTEKWNVRYPPTTEYVRMGTNPDPNLMPPKQEHLRAPQAHGKGKTFRMFR